MEKKIEVHWDGKGLEFTGTSTDGTSLKIDGNQKTGPSPMALILYSLAACAAIDVVHILKTMRVQPEKAWVEVDAEREEGNAARKWSRIHLRFFVTGDVPEAKSKRAIQLSVEKYCSVYRQLVSGAEISTELAN